MFIENSTIKVAIEYKGKKVLATKLMVASNISLNIKTAWAFVKTSKLLNFITKGKVTFKPLNGMFPIEWEQGSSVKTKMLLYGFLPFGGTHTLFFEKIDEANKILYTKESDSIAKIWNHKITMQKIDDNNIYYKDEVIIYAGILTRFVVLWSKLFYKHRQKRWQLVSLKDMYI